MSNLDRVSKPLRNFNSFSKKMKILLLKPKVGSVLAIPDKNYEKFYVLNIYALPCSPTLDFEKEMFWRDIQNTQH